MHPTSREIEKRFAPPRVDEARMALKTQISDTAADLAQLIHQTMPGSDEEAEALGYLEAAVFWAHAGVDRRYVAPGEPHPSVVGLSLARFNQL